MIHQISPPEDRESIRTPCRCSIRRMMNAALSSCHSVSKPGPIARPSMGFDIGWDECDDDGGRSGSVFMRSGFGVGVRRLWLWKPMAVLDRNRVTGGGCVCLGKVADCDRCRRVVGECMGDDGGAVSGRNDTDFGRSGGDVGAVCRMHDLLLLDRKSGVGECSSECIDIGESIDDMAESDWKDTCLRSAFLGHEGSGVAMLLRGTGFAIAE